MLLILILTHSQDKKSEYVYFCCIHLTIIWPFNIMSRPGLPTGQSGPLRLGLRLPLLLVTAQADKARSFSPHWTFETLTLRGNCDGPEQENWTNCQCTSAPSPGGPEILSHQMFPDGRWGPTIQQTSFSSKEKKLELLCQTIMSQFG